MASPESRHAAEMRVEGAEIATVETVSRTPWKTGMTDFVVYLPTFADAKDVSPYFGSSILPYLGTRSGATPREMRLYSNRNKAKARRLRYRCKRKEDRQNGYLKPDPDREYDDFILVWDDPHRATKALFSSEEPPVHATRLALRSFFRDNPRMRIPVPCGHLGDIYKDRNGASIPVREVMEAFEMVYASPLRSRQQYFRDMGAAEFRKDRKRAKVQAGDPECGIESDHEMTDVSENETTSASSSAEQTANAGPNLAPPSDFFEEIEQAPNGDGESYLPEAIPTPPKTCFGSVSCSGCGGALYAHNDHCKKCHVRTKAKQIRDFYEQYAGTEIFTVLLKVIMFMRQTTTADKGLILLDIAREYGRDSIERSADIIERVVQILLPLREYWQSVAPKGDAVQSGDSDESFVGTFHSWIKMMRALGNTRVKGILTALYSLLSIGLAAKCGETMSVDHIADAVNTCTNLYRAASPFEAILHGLDNFVNLVRAVVKGGWDGLTEWFKPARGIGEIEMLVVEINKRNSQYNQMSFAERAEFRTLVVKADKWYKENEGWLKSCPIRDFNLKDRGIRILAAITDAKSTLAFFEHANNREKPVTLVFCGGTEIGKSCLQNRACGVIMAAAWNKNIPVEQMHDLLYYWPLGSKFADGLHAGVGGVIIDDMAAKHPQKQPEGDPAISLVHAMSNIAPFFPNNANAADKGKIPCHPAALVISTNINTLNVVSTFQEAAIIYRRINYFVSVRPKKEYSVDGILDGNAAAAWNFKAFEEGREDLEDWWDVQVHVYHVRNGMVPASDGKLPSPKIGGHWERVFPAPKFVGDNSDEWAPIEDFWYFLGEKSKEHFAKQTAHVNEMKTRKVDYEKYCRPRKTAADANKAAKPGKAPDEVKKPPEKAAAPKGPVAGAGFATRGQDVTMGGTEDNPVPSSQPPPWPPSPFPYHEDPEGLVLGGHGPVHGCLESGDVAESSTGLFSSLRQGFEAGAWLPSFGFFQRSIEAAPVSVFTQDGPRPPPNTDTELWVKRAAIAHAQRNERWAKWGCLEELPPGEPPPVEATYRTWWKPWIKRVKFDPDGNGTEGWDSGPFRTYFGRFNNFLPGLGFADFKRRHEVFEEAKTARRPATSHQRDVKHTAHAVHNLTVARGLLARETGALGWYLFLQCATGGMLVFGTFRAIARGQPIAAAVNYACTVQNIWTSGWAIAANAALFVNCFAKSYQALRGPLDEVSHRMQQYNDISEKVRKWADDHAGVLKTLLVVAFTLMVMWGYKVLSPEAPVELQDVPADDSAQSSNDTHPNESIGAYTDFAGPQVKLPEGIKSPGVLTDERLTTQQTAERYSRKMALAHQERSNYVVKIAKNTFVTALYTLEGLAVKGSAGHAMFVNNSHFVINAHVIRARDKAKWLRLTRVAVPGMVGEKLDIPLDKLTFTTVPDDDGVINRDLLVGKLTDISMSDRMADLVGLLPQTRCKSSLRVNLLGKTGTAHYDGEEKRWLHDPAVPDGKVMIVSAVTRTSTSESIANTVSGDCGRVYYSGGPDNLTDPFMIVGIHTGVNNYTERKQKVLLVTPLHGVADVVRADSLNQQVQQGDPANIHNLGAELPLPPTHFKAVPKWAEKPQVALEHPVNMKIFGAWGGHRSDDRSRLKESILWKYINLPRINGVAGEDIADGKVVPDFRGVTVDGCPKIKQAQWLSLLPSATPPPWDQKVYEGLKEASNLYLEEIVKHKDQWQGELRKLTLEEAVNGVPGKRAFEGLNFSSSAGHPFYCKKNQLFSMRADNTREISEELRQLVEKLESGLKRGEVYPVFSSQIKDEVVSVAKDQIGKYRVFQMSPVDFTIVTRMYGLSFVRVMSLFPYMFGACVGMNATSEQWTQLAHFLGVGQDFCKIFDGDYVNFDKSMRPEVTRCVREFIVDLHRDVFSEEDLTTLDNILKVTYSPVVNYFGTILQFLSVNPSGGGLTTQTNCAANNIFVRYSWIQLYGPKVGNRTAALMFRRCVHLVTYGDDLLCSINTKVVPVEFVEKAGNFSCKTMQAALAKINIQFTDAAKNTADKTQDYSPHDKITFLKRLFVAVHCPGYGYDVQYTAPLDKKSLSKMLHYTMDKNTVAPLDVLKSTLKSLGIESYFQGREFFECMRLTVLEALEEYSKKEFFINVDDFIFPTYDMYQAWYVATVSQAALYADPCDVSPGNVHPIRRDCGSDLMSMPAPLAKARNLNQCMAEFDVLESGDPPHDGAIVVFTAGTAPQGARISDQRCEGLSVPRTYETLPEKRKEDYEAEELQMGDPLTKFYNAGQERTEELGVNPDSSFDTGEVPDYTLANWLARPVKIAETTWNENADFALTLNPWYLFYNNSEIYSKLKGFCRLRSKLHVKLILSASPFQYSMGIMSYKPLGDDTTTDTFCGGMNGLAKHAFPDEALLSIHTSRPHVYFYPQFSRGCEMTLPFLYYKNWIQLDTNLGELSGMGTMNIFSVRKLRSATGLDTVQPVTVSVYAWAEDVRLSGPSYSLQSGDPPLYTVRPSLINNFATPGEPGHVEKIALDASNSVSCDSAVVGAAGDQMSFKSIMDRDVIIANCDWDATDPAGKVLLIQNVTPCVTWRKYINEFDETKVPGYAIQMTPSAHLATAFNWWEGAITYRFKAIASQVHRGKLALSYEPDGFKGTWTESALTTPRMVTKIWDIANDPEFEFTVPYMASKAHLLTGRMREAVWGLNTTYKNPTLPTGTANVYKPANYNGALIMSVINPLTSSDPAAGIGIVVTMNAGDVHFSEPTELDMPLSMYELQSGDAGEEGTLANEPDVSVEVSGIEAKEERAPYIYMGETVDHLLPLLKRTTKYRSLRLTQYEQKPNDFYTRYTPELNATKTIAAKTLGTTFMQPMLPLGTGTLGELVQDEFTEGVIVGPDTESNPPATKIIPGQTERLNTPTAYFSPCFVGWRGSHIYKAKVAKSNKVDGPKFNEFSLSRCTAPLAIIFEKLWTHMPAITHWSNGNIEADLEGTGAMAALLAKSRKAGDMFNQGSAGMTQTNVEEIPFSEAEFPYYSSYRMMPANPTSNFKVAFRPDALSWNQFDQAAFEYQTWSNWCLRSVVQYPTATSNMLVHEHPEVQLYHSVGHDFTLLQYLNVPTMFCYNFSNQLGTGVIPAPWWVA